jgi:hypothetical protein
MSLTKVQVSPVLLRVAVPLGSGALTYWLTSAAHESTEWTILLSTFVGGIVLVVQFLVGVDRDLEAMKHHVGADIAIMRRTIEEHFSKIGDATRIYSTINSSPLADSVMDVVENLAGITGESPELGRRLLGSEIQSLTHLLKGFTEGRATYEGEDQDWILVLTEEAKKSIDAISTRGVDGGTEGFGDGFWTTRLGIRYLVAQRKAHVRQVCVRRLFILESPQAMEKPDFRKTCKTQLKSHVEVRVLDPTVLPELVDSEFFDYVIFDDAVIYESITVPRFDADHPPGIEKTEITTRSWHNGQRLAERRQLFEELWAVGKSPI